MKKSSIKPNALRVVLPLLTGMFLLLSPSTGAATLPEGGIDLRYESSMPLKIAQGYSRKRAEQWQRMAPAEKETMRQRMDQWNQMPPQERQRYQQRYDQWRQLSPDEQRQIDRKLDRWQNLSPSEKEDVRRRFR